MKRNLSAVFAVVIAIALSSFSGTRISYLYLKYVPTMGAENLCSSYSPIFDTQTSPTFDHVNTTIIPSLNWIRIIDLDNDGFVDLYEFLEPTTGFPQYDTDGDGFLKDEAADITGKLDLKNK